jgi:hypothetical protein
VAPGKGAKALLGHIFRYRSYIYTYLILLVVLIVASYIAFSGQWGFLIKLSDLLCLDFLEKVIIFITLPRKRLLGQRIFLGVKLGERVP